MQQLKTNSHEAFPEQFIIPSNKHLTEVTKILKPNINQLVEDANAVRFIHLSNLW